eukprot:735805-Rhodomonas_salina.1
MQESLDFSEAGSDASNLQKEGIDFRQVDADAAAKWKGMGAAAALQKQHLSEQKQDASEAAGSDSEVQPTSEGPVARTPSGAPILWERAPSGVNAGLPVRWMAPEVIATGRWSDKSDVWAYGARPGHPLMA